MCLVVWTEHSSALFCVILVLRDGGSAAHQKVSHQLDDIIQPRPPVTSCAVSPGIDCLKRLNTERANLWGFGGVLVFHRGLVYLHLFSDSSIELEAKGEICWVFLSLRIALQTALR